VNSSDDNGWARDVWLGRTRVPVQTVIQVVAAAFDMSTKKLLSRSREEPDVTARLLTYYLLKELTSYSEVQLGGILDLDRTCINRGAREIRRRLLDDERLSLIAARLQTEILRAVDDPNQPVPNTH
jgi:chromosomal replication initiation ATPase DnaA